MRSHVRRGLSIVVIGAIALLVVPARAHFGTPGMSERQYAPQLAAVTLSTTQALSPSPRARPIDVGFVGVIVTSAFSIAVAWRAMRRPSSRDERRVRASGYARRRGPPFALA